MEHEQHEHVFVPQHRHHFETEQQQREAGSFGMWLFLLTEIMFFGGMFFAYLLYRNWYYDAFVPASNYLSVPLGGANTAILITSGFFMALAVWAAEMRKKKILVWTLIATMLFGWPSSLSSTSSGKENGSIIIFPASTSTSRSSSIPRPTDHQRKAARARHGAAYADLLLPLLRHDRHARPAHDHRHRPSAAGCWARAARDFTAGTSRRLRTSGSTGTSSILCGFSCFRCCT